MQGAFLSLGLLASAAVGVAAAEELKIDVTQAVECERKTQKGDRISVHYRGRLESNGQEFDASALSPQTQAIVHTDFPLSPPRSREVWLVS